jgi:hypothetical protein
MIKVEFIKVFRVRHQGTPAIVPYGAGVPTEVIWLKENYKEFVDYRWFNRGIELPSPWAEVHILSEELSIIFALKFRKATLA